MIDSFDHFASGATSGSAEPSTSTSTGGNIVTEIISESDGAINDEPLVVICPYEIRSEFEVPNDFKTNNAKISFNETSAPVEKIILRKDGGLVGPPKRTANGRPPSSISPFATRMVLSASQGNTERWTYFRAGI